MKGRAFPHFHDRVNTGIYLKNTATGVSGAVTLWSNFVCRWCVRSGRQILRSSSISVGGMTRPLETSLV